MDTLFEQTFMLVVRIATSILEGTADAEACAMALSAQADQVQTGVRDAESAFDSAPGEDTLGGVTDARAAFCGQVAGERLLEAFVRRGEWGITRALDTFDRTANVLIRYLNAESEGDRSRAMAAVEEACSMLPVDRRVTLSPPG
jgi:hypothetical protein